MVIRFVGAGNSGGPRRHSAIAIGADRGLPVISYQDRTARTLRVTKCASRTCQ